MTKLRIEQSCHVALQPGFVPEQTTTLTATAVAESRGDTGALNDRGEHSVGLWLIHIAPRVRGNMWGDLHDRLATANTGDAFSYHGTDRRPWGAVVPGV